MNTVYYIKDSLPAKKPKGKGYCIMAGCIVMLGLFMGTGTASPFNAKELITASWEQAEEEKLWDEQIAAQRHVSSPFRDNETRFRISVLNSAEFISRIHEEITADKKSLAEDACNNNLSTDKALELLRLKRNLSISITEPYTNEQIDDLDFIPKIPVILIQQKNLCSAPRPGELLSGYGLFALAPGPAGSNTGRKKTANSYFFPLGERIDAHAVNLLEYSLDHTKANYFELILYLWEDSPWPINGKALFPSVLPVRVERLFRHYFYITINSTTSSKTSKDLGGGLA